MDQMRETLQYIGQDVENYKAKISEGGFLRTSCLSHLAILFPTATKKDIRQAVDEYVNDGYCPRCGCAWVTHDGDGGCVED